MRRAVAVRGSLVFLSLALLLLVACGGEEEAGPTVDTTTGAPVSFTTYDNVIIDGRLFGDGDVAVILCHMFPNDQTAWFPFAPELAQKGFAALTFDFRGYGESGGDQEISEIPRDLEAAVDFMRGQGFSEIYLVGASMGGTASLIVAAQDEVAGVVAISAPQSFQGLEALDVVADVTEPKLFIASEGDLSAVSSLELFFEKAPDPKEERLFTGSAHGTELLEGEHSREFRDLIIGFISSGEPGSPTPSSAQRIAAM